MMEEDALTYLQRRAISCSQKLIEFDDTVSGLLGLAQTVCSSRSLPENFRTEFIISISSVIRTKNMFLLPATQILKEINAEDSIIRSNSNNGRTSSPEIQRQRLENELEIASEEIIRLRDLVRAEKREKALKYWITFLQMTTERQRSRIKHSFLVSKIIQGMSESNALSEENDILKARMQSMRYIYTKTAKGERILPQILPFSSPPDGDSIKSKEGVSNQVIVDMTSIPSPSSGISNNERDVIVGKGEKKPETRSIGILAVSTSSHHDVAVQTTYSSNPIVIDQMSNITNDETTSSAESTMKKRWPSRNENTNPQIPVVNPTILKLNHVSLPRIPNSKKVRDPGFRVQRRKRNTNLFL